MKNNFDLNTVNVKGLKTEYVDFDVKPIDTLEGLIKKLGCYKYTDRYYRYFVRDGKLLSQYDESYHGSPDWSDEELISDNENIVELFTHLESAINILKYRIK